MVVATGTASGKSLAYQLPVLRPAGRRPGHRVLYLSPTKALAADQLRSLSPWSCRRPRRPRYDGDTPTDDRDWVRAHANWVLTNPDMLHRGLLPAHARWARVLRRLRYVVVDECHAYRGVFGSHVALVLRRLRRVCRGATAPTPVFMLASATSADPADSRVPADRRGRCGGHRGRLAPRRRTFALWEPPLLAELAGENGAPVRRSARAEAAGMLADLVDRGRPHPDLRPLPAGRRADRAGRPAQAGRGGAGDSPARWPPTGPATCPRSAASWRRALARGELLGVASTNALELGVDIAGLDAVVLAGYPGTLASFWQQAGRAGRARLGERWWCSSPGTTRWTPTWCTTRRRCSGGRSRRP